MDEHEVEHVDTRDDVPEARESVRLAQGFADLYFEKFAEAEFKKGYENQHFAVTVRQFDQYLLDYGWLDRHPTEFETGSSERNGRVMKRNQGRKLLNYAATRGQHGWPAYEVQDDRKGNYRVRLQTNLALIKHEQIAKAIKDNINGHLQRTSQFYKTVQQSQRLPIDLRMRAMAHEQMLAMVVENAAMQVANYLKHASRFQETAEREDQRLATPLLSAPEQE